MHREGLRVASHRSLGMALGWMLASCSAGAIAAGSGPAIVHACGSVGVTTVAYDMAKKRVDDETVTYAAQALADLRGRFSGEPTQFALAAGLRHADYLLRLRMARLLDARQPQVLQAQALESTAPVGAVVRAQRAATSGTMR